MLCQNCQKKTANVHLSQIINNSKVDMYLCDQCAKDKGQLSFNPFMGINDFFKGLMGFDHLTSYINPEPQQLVCEKCGMGYEEFQRLGKIGCADCYEIYSQRLEPILKRLHGSTNHVGKMPEKVSKDIAVSKEIAGLKETLNRAIKDEEYEKAAEIRDRIKGIEAENKNG